MKTTNNPLDMRLTTTLKKMSNVRLTKEERLAYLRERNQLFDIVRTLTAFDYKYVYEVTRHFQYDKCDSRAIAAREAVVFHDDVCETDFSLDLAKRLITCQPFHKPLTNQQIRVLLVIRSLLRLQRRYGTSHIRHVKKLLEDFFNFPSIETLLREAREEEKAARAAFIESEKIRLAKRFKRLKVKNLKAKPYRLDKAFLDYICNNR